MLLALVFFGCTSENTQLHAESMRLSQNDDQVILTVLFSGNVAPEQASGKLFLFSESGESLYDREFTVRKGDFKKIDEKFLLERYVKLDSNKQFSYAELYLYLPNQTFHAEQGQKPDTLELGVEVLSHEKQYAVHIDFIELGKKTKPAGAVELRILDNDGSIYKEVFDINENDFKEDYITLLLPYNKVPKSFYDKGNLIVKFKNKEKRIDIPLQQYSEKEKLQIGDIEFSSNAKPLANATDYVGFSFNVIRSGYYFNRVPEKTKLVRFDAKIKNTLKRPQYLMRDDFYIKDSDKAFYPVYGKLSSVFTPILKANEEINVSFYFNIIAEKDSYSLYYGDKKLAEFVR